MVAPAVALGVRGERISSGGPGLRGQRRPLVGVRAVRQRARSASSAAKSGARRGGVAARAVASVASAR